MPHRIPQSVAIRVPLKAYLTSDHVSDATSKAIAIQISKNGAAFGNLNVGAASATEIGSGWYYAPLDATDTGTLGPLVIRGTCPGVDNVEIAYQVVDANSMGAAYLDAAMTSRSTYAGADTSGTTTLLSRIPGTVQAQTGDAYARIGAAGAGLTALGDTRIARLDADVSSRSTYAGADTAGTTTLLARIPGTVAAQTGDSYARLGAPTEASIAADIQTRSTFSGGAVASVTAPVTAGTVSDKTGYSLSVTPPTAAQVRTEMDSNSTKLANLDASVSGIPAAVWVVTTRTLSSFGSLVSDVATAVWAATTRTLSAFGFNVTASSVADKTGYALTSAYDAAKTAGDVTAASIDAIVLAILSRKVTYDSSTGEFVVWNATGNAEARRLTPTTDAEALPIVGMRPSV